MNLVLTYTEQESRMISEGLRPDDENRLDEYIERNQPDREKASNDNYIGDLAEYCVWKEFKNDVYKDQIVYRPDPPPAKDEIPTEEYTLITNRLNEIHGFKFLGHNPDEIIGKFKLYWHIKSCREYSRYLPSFTFQRNHHENMVRHADKLKNHYICGCTVNENKRQVKVVVIQKYDELLKQHTQVFGPPRLEYLRGNKMCLYYDKMIEAGFEPIIDLPLIETKETACV